MNPDFFEFSALNDGTFLAMLLLGKGEWVGPRSPDDPTPTVFRYHPKKKHLQRKERTWTPCTLEQWMIWDTTLNYTINTPEGTDSRRGLSFPASAHLLEDE